VRRRHFHRILGAGIAGAALAPFACATAKDVPLSEDIVKPRRLRTGDIVALISPGSYAPDEAVQKAYFNLENLGLKVKPGKHLRAQRGFTAGTDQQRLEDLHDAFADDEISAVWCVRGGYGCSRLLPFIDYGLIRQHPKILIGYSDITALIQAIHLETGLVCFHGPVASATFSDYAKGQLVKVLMEAAPAHTISVSESQLAKKDAEYQPVVLQSGRAQGVLSGGNLSLLAAMAGTPHAFDFTGKIVFIEEVGERPYRLDRMLTTLLQASNLDKAAGIALGVFTDCQPQKDELSLSLLDTLRDRLGDLGVPVVYGLSFGHVSDNCTLPVGIPAALDTQQRSIALIEAAVL
jgi:muramoyltetrapeptide carboxypeptidase